MITVTDWNNKTYSFKKDEITLIDTDGFRNAKYFKNVVEYEMCIRVHLKKKSISINISNSYVSSGDDFITRELIFKTKVKKQPAEVSNWFETSRKRLIQENTTKTRFGKKKIYQPTRTDTMNMLHDMPADLRKVRSEYRKYLSNELSEQKKQILSQFE